MAILNSEDCTLMNYFTLHKSNVQALLVMPKQVEPCICAEVPFPSADQKGKNSRISIGSQSSDSVLISSLGNGRQTYNVHSDKQEEIADKVEDIHHLAWTI